MFEWIKPSDRRWMEWTSLHDKMLVMHHVGPCIVLLPKGGGHPIYNLSYEVADPKDWLAWSAIPKVYEDPI